MGPSCSQVPLIKGMTSDTDDLEQHLRENLELRRELAAEVAKAKAASQRGGIAYRLGWVLYWACIVLIGVWVFGMVALLATTKDTIPDMVGEVMREPLAHLIWFGLPAIALYGSVEPFATSSLGSRQRDWALASAGALFAVDRGNGLAHVPSFWRPPFIGWAWFLRSGLRMSLLGPLLF